MGFGISFRPITFAAVAIVVGTLALRSVAAQGALVQTRLIADKSVVVPGDTVRVGAYFKIADDWHIYWKNSGASGLPTGVVWSLPSKMTAGELSWPMPTTHEIPEIGTCFIYEKEVVLFAEMTVAKDAPPGKLEIGAALSWLVCQESCVSGSAAPKIEIEVGKDSKDSPDAALLARFAARVPTRPKASDPATTHAMKKIADGKIEWTVRIAPKLSVDANRKILAVPRDDGGPTIESIVAERAPDGAVVVKSVLSPRAGAKDAKEKTAIFEIAFCESADPESAQGSKLIERFLVIEGEIGVVAEQKAP